MALSFLNQNNLPRGLRNNNPGNLIYTNIPWQGKISYANNTDWSGSPNNIVKHFEQFTNIRYGIRAMAMDMLNDITENSYTLSQLIYEYAPPAENNTTAYIQFVSNATGLAPNAVVPVNINVLVALVRSMINMENGTSAGEQIPDAEIINGIQMLPQVWLAQLGDFVKENKRSIMGALLTAGAVYGVYRYAKSMA